MPLTASDTGFGITVLGIHVAILTDHEVVRHVLNRFLLPWLPRVEIAAANAQAVFRVNPSPGGAAFQVCANGGPVQTAAGLMEAVTILQQSLDEFVIHGQTRLAAIHAGAVAIGGRAVLLPGISHSGKSSLVAELIRRGAVYFSDEYALIDALGLVHPYPRALMLRHGRPGQVPVLPSEFHAESGTLPAPIRLILALQYHPQGVWDVRPVSQSEGLMLLLQNTPHVLADSPWILPPLHRAADGVGCYTGIRGDAGAAAAVILALLQQRP